MKKSLLMVAAFAFMFSTYAQKPEVTPTIKKIDLGIEKNNTADPVIATPFQRMNVSTTKANFNFTPVRINSSGNPYGILLGKQNVLAAHKDLNVIMLSHRGGPVNGLGGQILGSFSTNGGTNWDTTNIIYDGDPNQGRYPSGVIFNPSGNSDINNAYAVVGGPALQVGASGWGFDFFAWKKFNAATAEKYALQHDDDGRLCRINMQVAGNNIWMTGDAHTDDGTYYTGFNHVGWKGVYDNNNFTWTPEVMTPNYLLDPSTNNPLGRPYSSYAFNADGTVGYFVHLGIPAGTTTYSYRPIVKKTTDGGATWTDLPDFDFSTLQQIQEVLPGTAQDENIVNPFVYMIEDAVVDKNGNLNILSYILPGATLPNDIDSIGYTWQYTSIEGVLFNLYTTASGWDAEFVDIVYAQDAENALGDVSYDARPQMALSTDGSKIFFTWGDTDPDYATTNLLPDLRISGFDVDSKWRTESFNVTKNSAYEASAFLHATAPQAWKDGSTYTIHNVICELGASDLSPINYIYLKGVEIMESDFAPVSINNIDKNLAAVSQSYPNPTNGTTSVDVTLVKGSELSIQIVNIMGQVVYTESKGNVAEGKHRFTFDASQFRSGIYFYTVKAGNSNQTSKMIVQ